MWSFPFACVHNPDVKVGKKAVMHLLVPLGSQWILVWSIPLLECYAANVVGRESRNRSQHHFSKWFSNFFRGSIGIWMERPSLPNSVWERFWEPWQCFWVDQKVDNCKVLFRSNFLPLLQRNPTRIGWLQSLTTTDWDVDWTNSNLMGPQRISQKKSGTEFLWKWAPFDTNMCPFKDKTGAYFNRIEWRI